MIPATSNDIRNLLREQLFGGDLMPTRILLVDTDAIERIDVKACLTKQGYLVVGEASRSSAMVLVKIRPPITV